jgi:hypothetical protein
LDWSDRLSSLQITWNHAAANDRSTSPFISSINRTHCPLQEPRQALSSGWYSHKTSGAALTYQIVLSIRESKLLSVVGPYQASVPDITVFKCPNGVYDLISNYNRLIGYKGCKVSDDKISIPNPNDSKEVTDFKKRVRARHETLNSRLKIFNVLTTLFRHFDSGNYIQGNYIDHEKVFKSVCVLVKYNLIDNPLFDANTD